MWRSWAKSKSHCVWTSKVWWTRLENLNWSYTVFCSLINIFPFHLRIILSLHLSELHYSEMIFMNLILRPFILYNVTVLRMMLVSNLIRNQGRMGTEVQAFFFFKYHFGKSKFGFPLTTQQERLEVCDAGNPVFPPPIILAFLPLHWITMWT